MKDMKDKIILLIEDNPDDAALTRRALEKNNIKNDVVVVHDGAEALDYLFGTGSYAGRDLTVLPASAHSARLEVAKGRWFRGPPTSASKRAHASPPGRHFDILERRAGPDQWLRTRR